LPSCRRQKASTLQNFLRECLSLTFCMITVKSYEPQRFIYRPGHVQRCRSSQIPGVFGANDQGLEKRFRRSNQSGPVPHPSPQKARQNLQDSLRQPPRNIHKDQRLNSSLKKSATFLPREQLLRDQSKNHQIMIRVSKFGKQVHFPWNEYLSVNFVIKDKKYLISTVSVVFCGK